MSVIQTTGGVKITGGCNRRRKGAKKSKANKASRVKYRNSGMKFKHHAHKLEKLADKLEKRIIVGATHINKVEKLKIHIKSIREAAKRWLSKGV